MFTLIFDSFSLYLFLFKIFIKGFSLYSHFYHIISHFLLVSSFLSLSANALSPCFIRIVIPQRLLEILWPMTQWGVASYCKVLFQIRTFLQ